MRNRCAHLRWWAEHTGKPGVVPSNSELGLPARGYDPTPKAHELDHRLDSVASPHVRASLELQAAFGLRREEAMKIQPATADEGDRLRLEGSWCKGGREREIPIETPEQRAVLDRAHGLAGRGSLIPPDRSYVQHLRCWERETRLAGLSKTHGLRHQYAQQRYQALTGRPAPAAGGPASKELTGPQRAENRNARQTIARELGHERIAITTVYLGR